MSKTIWVIRTGCANLASVCAAAKRLGFTPKWVESSTQILGKEPLILPGVGAFGAAMSLLEKAGFVHLLRERIQEGLPTLTICLGLQLLAEESEESPGDKGLGVISDRVERFPEPLSTPQFGWSMVSPKTGSSLFQEGYAYFANSYCLKHIPEGWDGAWADYGGPFVAAIAKPGVLACQFHPELSAQWGHDLLVKWAKESGILEREDLAKGDG